MTKTIDEIDQYFNMQNPNFAFGSLRDNRLDRMRLILSRLGNPERSFRSYHIAGSKGKGTTATYLSKIIDDNLGKCGLYMSPHVFDVRERFTNASRFFPLDTYLKTFDHIKGAMEDFVLPEGLGSPKPTTFELYTAYAYLLFKEAGCKYAVIETGLGGRLDATNTLENPEAVIFTEIELEHTNVLGSTYEEIAAEKLGIYKPGAKVFYYQQRLKTELDKKGIDATAIDVGYKELEKCDDGYRMTTNDGCGILLENASKASLMDSAFAYGIARKLSIIDKDKCVDLRSLSLPARFQQLQLKKKNILMILEGAHTKVSCMSALESLEKLISDRYEHIGPKDVTLIFSLAEGKDMEGIISEIFPSFENVVITGLGEFKKSKPEEIFRLSREMFPDKNISLEENASSALDKAISITSENGIIFTLGSFYLADGINKALKEKHYVD